MASLPADRSTSPSKSPSRWHYLFALLPLLFVLNIARHELFRDGWHNANFNDLSYDCPRSEWKAYFDPVEPGEFGAGPDMSGPCNRDARNAMRWAYVVPAVGVGSMAYVTIVTRKRRRAADDERSLAVG